MMETFENISQSISKNFSLCDAEIDEILIDNHSIKFCFSRGFYCIENEKVILSKKAFIRFNMCDASDFTCHIFKRVATAKGAELYGKPYSLEEISDSLRTKGRKIEIYTELYDFDFLYWRGVFLPYNMTGLSDRIDIELSAQVSVTYSWE